MVGRSRRRRTRFSRGLACSPGGHRGVPLWDIDPSRAVEFLREAETLARRIDHRFLVGLAPLNAALVKTSLNLRDRLTEWAHTLSYLVATRNPLGVRGALRPVMPALLAVGRPDLVAVVDGAALPYSTRPRLDDQALVTLLRQEITVALDEFGARC